MVQPVVFPWYQVLFDFERMLTLILVDSMFSVCQELVHWLNREDIFSFIENNQLTMCTDPIGHISRCRRSLFFSTWHQSGSKHLSFIFVVYLYGNHGFLLNQDERVLCSSFSKRTIQVLHHSFELVFVWLYAVVQGRSYSNSLIHVQELRKRTGEHNVKYIPCSFNNSWATF